jgi:hypothetical protein
VTSIAARCRLLLAGLATAATLAAPAAAAAATTADGAGCPDRPIAQPFAPWHDTADYFLAPGGDFEHGDGGWQLEGGARTGGGNEPFRIVAPTDARSLRLPPGSVATSPAFCIGVEHRALRLFARGAASSSAVVDILYADERGAPRTLRIATLAGGGGWAPSDVVELVVNALAAARGNAMTVRLRVAPQGATPWAIDDLHVDPYRGR